MLFEKLESRVLLSSATIVNGVLTVLGSPARDHIRVDVNSDTAGSSFSVIINGHQQSLPATPIPQQIIVRSGKGNDVISYNALGGSGPITIDAGSGNDRINLQAHFVTVHGGTGNDSITAFGVASIGPIGSIFGDDGNDKITIHAGTATLHGGNGNDTLIADDGDDQLFGDDGNVVLKGGTGTDQFFGGSGNDRLYSNDGTFNESVDGGAGKDKVYADQDCTGASPVARDILISIEKGLCS
jgi:Ca2+-binding RTX toxin-like protein